MYSKSLKEETKKLIEVVVYDPFRFLRAIREDDELSEWLEQEPHEEEYSHLLLLHHALSALSPGQLNEKDCQFVSLIEDVTNKIQKSGGERDDSFLSVQNRINYHKRVLPSDPQDCSEFTERLKEYKLDNQFLELAKKSYFSIEGENLFTLAERRVVPVTRERINLIEKDWEKPLNFESDSFLAAAENCWKVLPPALSDFLALIDLVNDRSANRK